MTDEPTMGAFEEVPVPPAPERSSDPAKRPEEPIYPEVELPRVGRVLAEFAHDMGLILRTNGVYLQDGEPVVLEPKTDRMAPLSAACFRTYAEKSLRTVKMCKVQRSNPDGSFSVEYVYRPDSMNKMQAEAVLTSHQFRELQRPLRRISRIPVPIFKEGRLTLQGPGYDAETKILVKE